MQKLKSIKWMDSRTDLQRAQWELIERRAGIDEFTLMNAVVHLALEITSVSLAVD